MRCSLRALCTSLFPARHLHVARGLGLGDPVNRTAAFSASNCRALPCIVHISTFKAMAAIYKPTEAIQLLRPCTRRPLTIPRKRTIARFNFSTSRAAQAAPSSSTSTPNVPPPPPGPMRRQVTVTNDTGNVRWTDLSPGEKAARTVQQSFNLSIVLVGVVLTVCSPPKPQLIRPELL